MHRLPVLIPVFALAAAPLVAQTQFRCNLNGAQVVPPTNSTAEGWGEFELNANNTLSYTVRTYGLTATAAHLFQGAAGSNGTLLFDLNGGPSDWEGATAALTAAQVIELRAGNLYVSVDNTNFPSGAIRGQLGPSPQRFAARLDGGQETPPVATSASGLATFVVNADYSITYNVSANGLSATAAHIHEGAPGVAGPILFTLSGGPTDWSGTTAPLTPDQFTEMQEDGLYVNVHTAANPNGEIRGQIVSEGARYGYACPWSGGTAELFFRGAPYSGELIQVDINGGVPNDVGLMIVSFNDIAHLNRGCGQLVGGPLLTQFHVQLDGSGSAQFPMRMPVLLHSIEPYAQFVGREPATGRIYTTNGVCLPIVVF